MRAEPRPTGRGPRDLAPAERCLVERLLDQVHGETAALRAQLDGARVRASCDCGCPSFRFEPAGAGPAPKGIPEVLTDAEATDPDGRPCGVILLVLAGRLHELEVYPYEDVGPFALPDAETLRR